MSKENLSITYLVDQSPEEVYNAINNVRDWWSEGLAGKSKNVNDEFEYWHKDLHYSKHKVIELIPGKRVVWEVVDGTLTFIKNQKEWIGTKVIFEIEKKGDKTQLHFTHEGLTADSECFEACSGGWNKYAGGSLRKLIETGKGMPDNKEIAAASLLK